MVSSTWSGASVEVSRVARGSLNKAKFIHRKDVAEVESQSGDHQYWPGMRSKAGRQSPGL